MPTHHAIAIIFIALGLSACMDNSEKNLQTGANIISTDGTQSTDAAANNPNPHNVGALLSELKSYEDDTKDGLDAPKPIITADGKTQIDWSYIDTKTKRVDAGNFIYPFAKDSQPVVNYAQAYNLTPEQAQHAMLLSMASPEALGKILDQLTDKYIAHSFRDGDKPTLIIQVSSDVVNERHDYVIADKFGEGLVLPIEIISTK